MAKKYVFDYKVPFTAPHMVREISKHFTLPKAYALQDIGTLFGVSIICLLICWKTSIGIGSVSITVSFLIAYSSMALLNRYEPEGKPPIKFVLEYVIYIMVWQLPKATMYHDQKITKDDYVIEMEENNEIRKSDESYLR